MNKKIKFILVIITFFSGVLFCQTPDTLETNSAVPAGFESRKISVDFRETSLKQVIVEIATKGNLKINFTDQLLPKNKIINMSFREKPAHEVLGKVLLGTGLFFKVLGDNQIVILRYENSKGALYIPKHTISGFISDDETGEALVGANVYTINNSAGCATNNYGFYSITLPEGIYATRFSFMGYESITEEIELSREIRKNIRLKRTSIASDTVIVIADENQITSTMLGTINLFPDKLASIPILFGEQDLLKMLHLVPGVAGYKEGDGGLYIRGGDSDQNLLLLDEAPVFNPHHFFGFFSVFNSEAIKNVKLIKGAAPARYGGRISSVIDIQLKEGNSNKFQGSAGIGLIFSRLTLQGPLFENASYAFSARRTYLDLFKYLSDEPDIRNSKLYFYDVNAKANYKISDNDRLYLSGYIGNDVLGFAKDAEIVWGNKTGTFRWNHLFSSKLFSNLSLVFSSFTHNTFLSDDEDEIEVLSKVNDIMLKGDFQYFFDENNSIQFGGNFISHSFLPAEINMRGSDYFNIEIGKKVSNEFSFYLSNEHNYSDKLKLDLGIRFTLFSVSGEPDIFDFADKNPEINIDFHVKESELYAGAEPRLLATYLVNDNSSFKLGYARNYQYMHMVSNSTSGTPLDIWQPVSKTVRPMVCDHISTGYFARFDELDSEFSVELFYKKMNNLIDYKDGANLAIRTYFESEYVFGDGQAYGLELFWKRNIGKLTGWLGYTLSRTERTFPDINDGKPFPAKFDRTHDVSIVLMYEFNEKWNFSANWVYATGNAITVPYGKYELNGRIFNAYSERNAYRVPAYHRLDLSLTYTTDSDSKWIFSLYNAYAKKNMYAMIFRNDNDHPGNMEAVRLSLFSIVPSVTYSMNF